VSERRRAGRPRRLPLGGLRLGLAGLLAGLAAALLAAAPAAAEIQVTSTLAPESAGVDEVVTYTIEAHGGGFDNLAFEPAVRLDNFDLVGGPLTAENISFVNGTLSRDYRVSWELRPHAPGKARVHASIRLNGQARELPVREIAVTRAGAGGAGSGSSGAGAGAPGEPSADPGEDANGPFARLFGGDSPLRRFFEPPRQRPPSPRVFVRAEVTPADPYVGQQALWTLYLYTREEINAINQESVPSFHGFWVRDIPQPQTLPHDMVEIDGERFARVPLMRKALFALHPGPLTVDPIEVELMVRPAETGFWGTTLDPPEPLRLRAPAVRVGPRALPTPPRGFAGAVGHVTLRAALEPRDLRLGEAATLTVTLSGDGHLSGVPAPELELPRGLKLLPPQQQGEDGVAGTTVRGRRTWSYAVIPERAGSFQVAVPPIPYFDPQTGAYRVAAAPAFDLTARPALAAATQATPDAPLHDIRSAEASGGTLARARRAWPAALPWLFALPWGIAAVVALARRRHGTSHGESGAGAAATGSARARAEAHLAAAAAEERPRQIAVEIEGAVGALLERWAVPAGTPPRQWRGRAAARGADAETAADLGRLADDVHYLRYAPQLSATGALRNEVLASCRRLMRRWR
jgi:hypothetical protein